MARRSTPQAIVDDRAFPIRVKFKVPRMGLGMRLNDVVIWLRGNVPPGDFAKTGAQAVGDCMAIHFRSVAIAAAFIEAFPDLELAERGLDGLLLARQGGASLSSFAHFPAPAGRKGEQ